MQFSDAGPTVFYTVSKPSTPPPALGGQVRPPGQHQQQQFQPPQQPQQQSCKKNCNYIGREQPYDGNSGSNGGNNSSNGGNNCSSSNNQGGEASWPSFNPWTGSIQMWPGPGLRTAAPASPSGDDGRSSTLQLHTTSSLACLGPSTGAGSCPPWPPTAATGRHTILVTCTGLASMGGVVG
jgi:hypothetical protein